MVKIARHDDAFSEFFEVEASLVEGQSLQQKEKKRRKRKGKKKEIKKFEKPKDISQNFDFCACPSKSVVKHDASGKKGMLLCCKCLLSRLQLIWPISSLKISQMSKTCVFGKKLREPMG